MHIICKRKCAFRQIIYNKYLHLFSQPLWAQLWVMYVARKGSGVANKNWLFLKQKMSRQAIPLCCKAPPCSFWTSVRSQLLVVRISCLLRKSTHEEREMAWGRRNGTDEPEFLNFLHCFATLQHTYFHYKQKWVITFILKEPYPVALGKSHSLLLLRDRTLEKDEVYFSKLVKHISEQWLKVCFILSELSLTTLTEKFITEVLTAH